MRLVYHARNSKIEDVCLDSWNKDSFPQGIYRSTGKVLNSASFSKGKERFMKHSCWNKPGMSGSPLVAYKNSKPDLIQVLGIQSGYFFTYDHSTGEKIFNYGVAVPMDMDVIDTINSFLDDIKHDADYRFEISFPERLSNLERYEAGLDRKKKRRRAQSVTVLTPRD